VDDLGPYEAVVLGSAVYAGSWMKDAVSFAERHGDALARMRVWLFSSGPLGEEVKDAEAQPRQLPEL
jgi:menaquinone-dependent protoporphyrinogen oxidase